MAAAFGFLAACVWIWCSPGIVFLFLTWILLAALTGKPVFICASFAYKRKREVLGVGLLAGSESCAVPRAAVGPSALLRACVECGWDGGLRGVSALGLNFLALVPVLLLGLYLV